MLLLLLQALRTQGDFFASDGAFSQSMMEGSWVTETIVSAVVSQYLLAKPASHAVVTWPATEDRAVSFEIATDIRYDRKLGYRGSLNSTRLGWAEVIGPIDDARPLISFTMSDFPSE